MIAEIKKYTFLVHHSDYAGLLNSLGEAGVVHIVEKRKLDENTEVALELKSLKKYRDAIRQLTPLVQAPGPDDDEARPEEVLDMFESLQNELEEAKQQIELLKIEAGKAKPWGSFNTDTIGKLEEAGWIVSLFECPEKSFDKQWQENNNIEIINRIRGRLYFAAVHKEDNLPDIRAEKVKIPERPEDHILMEIGRHQEKIESLKSELKSKSAGWISSLKKGTEEIINRFEYSEAVVQADRYAEDNLYVLEGWVPVSEDQKVQELLMRSDCYSFISDPSRDEKIPVILRNSKFSELFEPISKLFALPSYRELDLTPFFAPFFMLFFGFCLGDAGYGLLFIVAGFIIKRKINKSYKPVITLAQYFGLAAVIMGLLSGTFFGINLIDSGYTITEHSISEMKKANVPENTLFMVSQVKDVKFESRQSFTSEISGIIGTDDFSQYKRIILKNAESDLPLISSVRHFMLDSLNMFYLAILLGALQIIFGMILRIVNLTRMKGFKYSLSTIGWVILILS
ncbi:MAG: hypothetical protein JXN62_06735, partial [Bacteroidales bacterium]|nr:hypothetical protein [Bacteroidales bacterium]